MIQPFLETPITVVTVPNFIRTKRLLGFVVLHSLNFNIEPLEPWLDANNFFPRHPPASALSKLILPQLTALGIHRINPRNYSKLPAGGAKPKHAPVENFLRR